MGKGKTAKPPRLLTPVELEIMTHLWKLGEGTVTDVLELLPKERKLAYTSVSTVMRILEGKKVLGARKAGRGHVYYPLLSKDDYEATSLKQLVTQVFDGAPVSLVRRLLDAEQLSQDELSSIRRLLEERLKS